MILEQLRGLLINSFIKVLPSILTKKYFFIFISIFIINSLILFLYSESFYNKE